MQQQLCTFSQSGKGDVAFGLHQYECIVPLVVNSLQRGQVNCFSPWQPVGVKVILQGLCPGHSWSPQWPVYGMQRKTDISSI